MSKGVNSFLREVIIHNPELNHSVLGRYKDVGLYIKKLVNNARVISIHEAGKIIGVIAFYCNNLEDSVSYISLIAVDVNNRGKGIGAELIDMALLVSKKKGFQCCRLEVEKSNTKAISLYVKKGFSILIEHENKCVMQKKI